MRPMLAVLAIIALTAAGCGRDASETAKSTRKPAESANMIKLESGLEYKDIEVGTGPEAKSGDILTVHYKGWLDDGTVFDSSRKPGARAFTFKLGAGDVIPGWDRGLVGMKVGGMRELKIPPSLAYGDQEQPNIPANSTLHFTVELLQIGE